VLAHYYGTEVADGFFHSFSGWVVYIVAFLLLFAVGWLLDRFGKWGKGDGGGKSKSVARDGGGGGAKVVKTETTAVAVPGAPINAVAGEGSGVSPR
jgi:hypothetical protein